MNNEQDQKHIYHTLRINGEEIVLKITKGEDGRLYYRPTMEERERNPRLKPVKRKKLGDVLEAIEEFYDDSGHHQTPETILKNGFNNEFQRFIEGTKKNGSNPNRASTYSSVEYTVRHYVMPYFEGLNVNEVDDIVCRNMLGSLLRKAYSKSIIDKAYMFTNEFLKYLTAKRIIPYNPMDLVKKPTPDKIAEMRRKAGKKEKGRHYMTNEEIAKIKYVLYHGYDVEVKSRSGNGYILHKDFDQPEAIDFLLNTGLRSGELLALKYEMWDPEKKTINIQNARVTYTERDKNFKGKLVTTETDPKNSASKTVLKLTNKANELLQILHSKEPEGYTGYIVHQKNGDPIAVSSLECRIKRIVTAAGLSGITPHDFRHTFASVLYEVSGGDLQLVRKKLRHKDATTTANIYVDLRSDREDEYDLQIEI